MKITRQKYHQFLTFCPVFLNTFMQGTNLGWLAPVLNRSQDPTYGISLTDKERSWIASLQEPFKICGLIIGALLIDQYGRKRLFFLCFFLNLLGWVLIGLSTSTTILYVSRLFFGLAAGIEDIGLPIYTGENSFPELRGVFVGFTIIGFYGAMVMQFALAGYLSYTTVAIINANLGFIQFISFFLMKETTQYLLMRGRYEEAEKNYRWLFSDDAAEFESLKRHIQSRENSSNWTEFRRNPAYRKSLTIVVLEAVLTYSTGIWTLLPFISITFGSSKVWTANQFSILYGTIQLVAVFATSFVIERIPRRTILLVGFATVALAHASTSVLYYVHDRVTQVPYFSWLTFATITSYMTITSAGIVPIMIVQRGELFPLKIKALGSVVNSTIGSTAVFIISMTFYDVSAPIGFCLNFSLFTIASIIAFVFVHLFVPETKGKTLEEIQTLLEDS